MSILIPEWQAARIQEHGNEARNPALNTGEQWLHYTVELFERIPIAGALIALIDLVITAIVRLFSPIPVAAPVAPAPAPVPAPIAAPVVPAAPAPAMPRVARHAIV